MALPETARSRRERCPLTGTDSQFYKRKKILWMAGGNGRPTVSMLESYSAVHLGQ